MDKYPLMEWISTFYRPYFTCKGDELIIFFHYLMIKEHFRVVDLVYNVDDYQVLVEYPVDDHVNYQTSTFYSTGIINVDAFVGKASGAMRILNEYIANKQRQVGQSGLNKQYGVLPGGVNPQPYSVPSSVNPQPYFGPGSVNPQPYFGPGGVNPQPSFVPGGVNPQPSFVSDGMNPSHSGEKH
ncbi:unnamed protein product [Rotaria sordida]|uniref:Uncharacterized protein n=1 Tax=Rotaria sordida TaxID=392033 RepID=A0A815HGW6_9BILA|nr:unnamed protein product [Rotaria sordida]CAF1350624.1 unnamed protein product [Rotaria sordida]